MINRLLILFLMSSCSNLLLRPTPFTEKGGKEYGYEIIPQQKDNSYTAVFEGNRETKLETAKSYALLAAYEFCKEKNLMPLYSNLRNISREKRTLPTSGPKESRSVPTVYELPAYSVDFSCGKN